MGQEPVCWPKKDIRKDPFTSEDQSVKIENEEYTIPSNSPFYVQLDEVPRKDDPSRVEVYLTDLLAEDLDISETVVTVAHGSYFQTDDVLQIDDEQMKIAGISGNDLTVERGYGGTTPATHNNGTRFWLVAPFTEVYTTPQAREYQVHYGTATIPYKAGLVRFHEAHADNVIWITYYKTGHYNWAQNVFAGGLGLSGKLLGSHLAEEDKGIHFDIVFSDSAGGTSDLVGVSKILLAGSADGDEEKNRFVKGEFGKMGSDVLLVEAYKQYYLLFIITAPISKGNYYINVVVDNQFSQAIKVSDYNQVFFMKFKASLTDFGNTASIKEFYIHSTTGE